MAYVWQAWVRSKGEKAISCEPDAVTSLSKWLWLMSEGMLEASSRRTCLHWLIDRPKREGIQDYGVNQHVITTPQGYRRKVPAYGHEPINIWNEKTSLALNES